MFSFIIPVYNEENFLPQCLTAIKKQQGNFAYEIIVVDNNSTDQSAQIARDFDVKLIKESRQGVGMARSSGTATAEGEYIVHLDADTRLPEDFLHKVEKIFLENKNLSCLGARAIFYEAPKWKNIVLFILAYVILYPLAFIISAGRLGPSGFCMVFKKSDYQKTKGFNKNLRFGEDGTLARELSAFGKIRIKYSINCFVSIRRFSRWDNVVRRYLLNFIYLCLFNKPYYNELTKS